MWVKNFSPEIRYLGSLFLDPASTSSTRGFAALLASLEARTHPEGPPRNQSVRHSIQ